MDKNQGYEIIKAVMLENGRGFALGHAAEKTTYRICCGWLHHHRQLCRLQKCGSAPSCKADFTIFLCQQYGKK